MLEFLTNSWVVGIVGGILSGLVVAYLTRFLFSKRDSREHLRRVEFANRDLIYALRPGISEGQIPDLGILRSLIRANARRYGLGEADIFNPREISEELIKEIMDTSFLSAKAKTDYCEKLRSLTCFEDYPSENTNIQDSEVPAPEGDLRVSLDTVSTLFGAVAGLMALFGTIFLSRESSEILSRLDPSLISFAAATIVSVFFVLTITQGAASVNEFRNKRREFERLKKMAKVDSREEL